MAAGKAPMQISTEQGGVPQRAIDGSTSAFFSADTCTLTKAERVPWWYVNLLEPYMVQLVRLDFGKPCCGELKDLFFLSICVYREDLVCSKKFVDLQFKLVYCFDNVIYKKKYRLFFF